MDTPDWSALTQEHSQALVQALHLHFLGGGNLEISAKQLANEATANEGDATKLLDRVAAIGALRIAVRLICPCDNRSPLTEDDVASGICPHCHKAFEADFGAQPSLERSYYREARQSRDVCWILALHGMNTRGPWQESFNWLAARSYGRSVPVAIYKYGIVRPGAILKFRQRKLIKQVQERIKALSGETEVSGFGGMPDVIAHSLGTWLLGHALADDPSLRVGRVILTGCILRPDFDWQKLIDSAQVQAVLCHTASKDFWAGIAHYIIPDSGPSGVCGFNNRQLVGHAILVGGKHSDFFLEERLPDLFDTVWHPFLTKPEGSKVEEADLPAAEWRQACWPFRATLLRYLVLLVAAVLAMILAAALVIGLGVLARWVCQ